MLHYHEEEKKDCTLQVQRRGMLHYHEEEKKDCTLQVQRRGMLHYHEEEKKDSTLQVQRWGMLHYHEEEKKKTVRYRYNDGESIVSEVRGVGGMKQTDVRLYQLSFLVKGCAGYGLCDFAHPGCWSCPVLLRRQLGVRPV